MRGAAFQAAIASSVNHTVRLPRCRSASLYSDQFVTRRFGRGMWWRRSALYLCGMKRDPEQRNRPPPTPSRPSVQHAVVHFTLPTAGRSFREMPLELLEDRGGAGIGFGILLPHGGHQEA